MRTPALGARRRSRARAGAALYARLVEAARDPFLYRGLGVPDTLDGRFDLVGLYTFLLVHRLEAERPVGHELAQAVFDALSSDMDATLRELGVGDPSLPRRMKAMWEALHGRAIAYHDALRAAEQDALEAALVRNVWRGRSGIGAPAALARLVRAQLAWLAGQPLSGFAEGRVTFLAAGAASREEVP